jgi:hypothetical protein
MRDSDGFQGKGRRPAEPQAKELNHGFHGFHGLRTLHRGPHRKTISTAKEGNEEEFFLRFLRLLLFQICLVAVSPLWAIRGKVFAKRKDSDGSRAQRLTILMGNVVGCMGFGLRPGSRINSK